MDKKIFTFEMVLYLAAFLIGTILRFYQLGTTPLSDFEAAWAVQALPEFLKDRNSVLGAQPAYIFLTYLIHLFFGSSDFTARVWPALAGSLMVLAPALVTRRFPSSEKIRWTWLVLSFGLAFDPGLVTISRQAGSQIMAVSFFTLALAAWLGRYTLLTGIFAGLALISGSYLFPGLISFGITAGGMAILNHLNKPGENQSSETPEINLKNSLNDINPLAWDQKEGLLALLIALLTAFCVGTLFFRFPQGFSAWLASFETYFQGWIHPPSVSTGTMFLTLFIYELFPLIFFLVGLIRTVYQWVIGADAPRPLYTASLAWTLVTLFVVMLYPNRMVADLAWVILPLWISSSFELVEVNSIPKTQSASKESIVSTILSAFVFFLLALFWFTLSTISRIIIPENQADLRILVPLGTLVLIGLTTALVSLGWSRQAGLKGLAWGGCLALFLYNFSVLWGSAQLRLNQPAELWNQMPGTGQARLLKDTLDFLSLQEKGTRGSLDVLVTDTSPSLRWVTRDYPNTSYVSEPEPGELPSIIITREDQQFPSLAASYAGQDFTWWSWPGWQSVVPPNFIRWFNYREVPVLKQKVILWVRSDLLLGKPVNEIGNSPELPAEEEISP